MTFSKSEILKLFKILNSKLASKKIAGELYLVGGAVLCLAYDVRQSTQDIDAFFLPQTEIRKAAEAIAREESIDKKWLNDAVKGYLSPQGEYQPYLELDHLKVYTAKPEYLLAMKCLSFRIGFEFFDESDIRFLLRYLNVESYNKAVEIISRYYPKDKFPPKTFYALEEILKKKK